MGPLGVADIGHSAGSEEAECGHDDKPESVAKLAFGGLEDATGEGKGDGGPIVLKGVDHPGGKPRHFFASDVHGGGGTNDGVSGVGGEGDEDENETTHENSRRGGTNLAKQENKSGNADDNRLDQVESHRHRRAVPFKNMVGDPSGEKGPQYGHDWHDFEGDPGGGGNVGLHVEAELILEIENSDLVGAGAYGPCATVSHGVEPNQGVGEDGFEGLEEGNGHAGGVIDLVMDGSGKTGFIGSLFDAKGHQDGGDGGENRGDPEKPAPFARGDGEGKNGEAGENDGGDVADGDLAGLNHQAVDSREGPAFASVEPSGVDFDHARSLGLNDSVDQPDEGEGGKVGGETGATKDEVHDDGSHATDEERKFAANPVGEKTVKKLSGAVGERPDRHDVGDLGCGEMELMHDPGYGKTEVVSAHVKGGIEKAQGDPVESPAGAEALGVGSDRHDRSQGHPLRLWKERPAEKR